MILFIVIFVGIALTAFVCFLLINRAKAETHRYYYAAEKIVQEEMLDYSLKNPNVPRREGAPPARRVMLGAELVSSRPHHQMVFDPVKPVYIGREDDNQIVLYDAYVSAKHGCIHAKRHAVWLSNMSAHKGIGVRRGRFGKIQLAPKETIRLQDGDLICISRYQIRIRLFTFDYNEKMQRRRKK